MTDTLRFMDDRHAVAAEIRALMGRHRVSQNALAQALDMSQPSLSKRLNGRQSFDLDELLAVAKFFDVRVTDLLASCSPWITTRPEVPGQLALVA